MSHRYLYKERRNLIAKRKASAFSVLALGVAVGALTLIGGSSASYRVVSKKVAASGPRQARSHRNPQPAARHGGTHSLRSQKVHARAATAGSLRNPAGAASPTGSQLDDIIARLGATHIVSAYLGGPPSGFEATDDPNVIAPASVTQGPWLYALVRASSATAAGVLRARWEVYVVAAVLNQQLAATGAIPVFSAQVSVEMPNGEILPPVTGLGHPEENPAGDSPANGNTIRARAVAAGLAVRSLGGLASARTAPALVATTDHPEGVAASVARLLSGIFGPAQAYDGYFLEVDDAAGNPVIVVAPASSGVTQHWVRADLRSEAGP